MDLYGSGPQLNMILTSPLIKTRDSNEDLFARNFNLVEGIVIVQFWKFAVGYFTKTFEKEKEFIVAINSTLKGPMVVFMDCHLKVVVLIQLI
jgi:hypothetical protein